ncbi:MAG: hypothetical protein IT204_03485 [Fimbriimonadaceae bacterium]|nr:hypothetical protein [Fimbriimonadaceae bacterium]
MRRVPLNLGWPTAGPWQELAAVVHDLDQRALAPPGRTLLAAAPARSLWQRLRGSASSPPLHQRRGALLESCAADLSTAPQLRRLAASEPLGLLLRLLQHEACPPALGDWTPLTPGQLSLLAALLDLVVESARPGLRQVLAGPAEAPERSRCYRATGERSARWHSPKLVAWRLYVPAVSAADGALLRRLVTVDSPAVALDVGPVWLTLAGPTVLPELVEALLWPGQHLARSVGECPFVTALLALGEPVVPGLLHALQRSAVGRRRERAALVLELLGPAAVPGVAELVRSLPDGAAWLLASRVLQRVDPPALRQAQEARRAAGRTLSRRPPEADPERGLSPPES